MSNTLSFQNINLDVQSKSGVKRIVHNVHGSAKSGEMMAILGPSGAGKTSLLSVLTMGATSNGAKSYGKCTLNGTQIDQNMFIKHCCLVEQHDTHRAFLTCRETVRYAINFYNPESSEEDKDKEVNDLLSKMGLDGCADTKVGNQFVQGLSGGQKKRLSVAVALVKKPSLLFLDEPTSGLDAASAASVMNYIKQLAVDLNIIIVTTIHQPSSDIYFQFDKVMLLSQGRTAFFGRPKASVTHFADIGHPVPEMSNPADHLLAVINHEFTSNAQVDKVLDLWENAPAGSLTAKHSQEMLSDLVEARENNDAEELFHHKLEFFDEFLFVLQRQFKIVISDPMIYLGRAVGFVGACTFFAVIYIKSMVRTQDQVLNRLWLLMWLCGVPTSMAVVAVYSYNEEFATVLKEVRNGMYRMSTFLLASFILQVPAMFILAIAADGLAGFAIGNMWAPKYFEITLCYACILFCYECAARLLSVVNKDPLLGMLGYLNLWFTSFLFAGIMIPEEEVIWPFRVLCYIMPLKWGITNIAYMDAIDATYAKAYYCDPAVRTDCLFHYDDNGVAKLPGWSCTETPGADFNPLQCFGNEGWQTLDSLGMNFDTISSDDNVAFNFGCMGAIAVVFWSLYCVIALKRVGEISTIVDMPPPVLDEEGYVNTKGVELVATNVSKSNDKKYEKYEKVDTSTSREEGKDLEKA